MAKNNNLTDFLTDIANTIRATDGTATTPLTDANKIDPQDFSSRIVNYQNKTVSPSTSAQTVTKDTGYMALGTVTVNAMPSGSATIQNRTSGGTGVGYGQEVSLTAGYYSAQKFYNNIGAGTIDVTDLTITPNALSGSWDSTNNKYVVRQASKTADMQSTVTTAGYVSSSVGTKNKGTATVSAPSNLEIPKAKFEASGASIKTTSAGAGYIPASTTVGTIASGSATGKAGDITYVSHTQDSTNKKKFTVTGSVSAPAPTISAGYVSSGTAGSAANKTVSLTITDAQAQAAVGSGSATTPATTIKINPTLSTTYTTDKGYLLSVSATQSVTPTVVAGYVASGTAGTITVQNADTPAYVAQNSFATGTAPSGVTPTNLAAGSVYRLSSGYYHADRYYKVPNAPSGNIELTKATSTDVAAYATATVKTGSATPSATVAGSSSALTSPTAMNNQYFTVTPTASVGTAGWISSISNGTQLKYKVKDGSLASSLSITADPSLPVWDSDLNHFKISVSKSQSVTPVSTAGWLGTAATSTVSVSGSMDPGTIEVGTTLSGTAAVTPVIQNKTASVSGKTQITASPTTSTTGISTYYMAVETPENLNPLMANPYIETNGYGTSDHFISSSDSTVAGANGSGTYYIPLATGGVSTSGGGLSKGTASGGGLSGGGLTAGAGEVSITQNPEVTPSVSRSYTVSGATDSTYGVTTTPPSSGDYATFDPNATVNKEAKAKGRGSVTRAAVTRAAFSQTVTRADVKDTRTAGYIPARASTTVISSDSTTVSLGADSTTIPQTSGTSNYSSESSSTTTVNAGTNIYIPVAAATATGGTASASASIAKQPNATATGGTATASASQTGMTAGVSDTATSYYFTSSASATGGNASAASGYSTASASATGGNASVSKGITAGASASGASSGNKSATSTEVTKSATGTSASDSSTIYLKAAAGSVTGSNLTGTNDVNVYTTDGSNAGVNISGVVGTKATTEPTSGYYLAFTGSSSATAQTQTAKVTTAGYTPTNNSFATRSVSYSATNATKYFPIAAAEFEVSGGSVKTKASKAGYVPANTTVGTVASLTFPTTTASSAAQYYSSIASITPSTADQYLNLPVGYNNSGKYYKINAVATGTATGNAGTITYVSHTQDSTNKKKFTVTGTVTAPEPIVEPGYITTGTAGTQANRTVSLTITDAQAQAAVGSGSATTPATTITANPSTPVFNPETLKFDITVSKTQDVTPTVSAGYVSTGTAGTITVTGSSSLNMSQFGTTTDTPSSYTTLTLGGVYKLTAGYYNGDRYYKVPAGPSGNIQLTQATSTDVSTYATLSSAGTSPTSVTSQYFKITPTASVGIAGWISSINNGTVQNYTVRDKVGSSGSNTVYAINASLSDTNTSGISVSASSGGYTVSTSGWISTGTYGSANSGNKYLNNLMITPDKTLTAYVGYYDDPGGELDVGYNYGIIKIYDENCPDNPIVDMQGNEVSLPYGDSLDDPSYKQVTNQNGLLNQINLPTSTSGTASGSSVANITPGTSNQYLNLPEGYNVSNRYYIIKAVSNHSGAASSTTSGTIDIDNDHKANVEFTNTNNGIYVEPSASGVSRNYSVSTAGWIATGTYGDTSGSLTGSKYYINKITVPKDVPFAVDMKDDTTYDTTSYLTINNNTYRRISITNVSNSTVGVTSSSSNGTVNITQVNSINLGYNITNSTVQQSFTIPSLSIYSYNSSNKTTVTNLNNSANSVIGTYSGSGTIGTYTNTGTITNMSGSRTITTLGRSGSSGTLTISNNGYSLANTGTVNIITNAYGTVRIGGSTNADSKIYFINLAGTIPSGKTINSLENNGTITTLSGTGSIGTYSNTGSISYMTGSRTINYLGNSSNDGSIVINHLGYSSSHDGYVTIKESKYGFIEAGSANPSSSANPTWMLSYPMVSLADGASASTFRYLWFKVSSKPGRYLAAYKTSITGGASYYTNTFSSNTHTYLFDMSTTATRYFDLILFFDSPLGEAEVVTIGNASSSGTENGYNTEFTAPTGCNAVLFRMIRYSVTAGVYIDIHPTFIK